MKTFEEIRPSIMVALSMLGWPEPQSIEEIEDGVTEIRWGLTSRAYLGRQIGFSVYYDPKNDLPFTAGYVTAGHSAKFQFDTTDLCQVFKTLNLFTWAIPR